MKSNEKVVLAAISHYGSALKFGSDFLRNNKKFAKKLVRKNGDCYQYLSENLRKDPLIIKISIDYLLQSPKMGLVIRKSSSDEVLGVHTTHSGASSGIQSILKVFIVIDSSFSSDEHN